MDALEIPPPKDPDRVLSGTVASARDALRSLPAAELTLMAAEAEHAAEMAASLADGFLYIVPSRFLVGLASDEGTLALHAVLWPDDYPTYTEGPMDALCGRTVALARFGATFEVFTIHGHVSAPVFCEACTLAWLRLRENPAPLPDRAAIRARVAHRAAQLRRRADTITAALGPEVAELVTGHSPRRALGR